MVSRLFFPSLEIDSLVFFCWSYSLPLQVPDDIFIEVPDSIFMEVPHKEFEGIPKELELH